MSEEAIYGQCNCCCVEDLAMSTYEIYKENGKFGLTYGKTILLKPIYKSLAITNNDPPEYTLKDFEDDPSVYNIREWNYPIVIADGKYGLVDTERMFIDAVHDRIVKLTYYHYFSQRDTAVSLYTFSDFKYSSHGEKCLTMPREFTLGGLLHELAKQYHYLYEQISKVLYEIEPDKYVSEYRYYTGSQYFEDMSYYHGFVIGATKHIIHNDFRVEPLKLPST
jgi:hypothetical protein